MKELILLLAVIPVISASINFLLAGSVIGRRYRIFVAPGVIVHETAHAFGCLITGTRITGISLFAREGGSVEHQRSPIPVVGQIIISLAPFAAGIGVIYLISRYIGFNLPSFDVMNISYNNIKDVILSFHNQAGGWGVSTWLFFYLLVSVAVTMNPSFQDLKNIFFSAVAIALSVYAVYRFTDFRPDLLQYLPPQITAVLASVVILLILCSIFSIVIYAVSKLVRPI